MVHRRFMRQSGKRYPENDVVVGVTKLEQSGKGFVTKVETAE